MIRTFSPLTPSYGRSDLSSRSKVGKSIRVVSFLTTSAYLEPLPLYKSAATADRPTSPPKTLSLLVEEAGFGTEINDS